MTEQLLKCPNCGANATNHENCEYCGSLLVRFVEKGIDLTKTTYMTNDNVFPGLTEELHANLRLQKQYPNQSVVTDIYTKDNYNNTGLCVLRTGYAYWSDGIRVDCHGKTEGFVI